MGIALLRETVTKEDADGTITETVVERTSKVVRNDEPDYIKLYTNMWCEFNQIPDAYRDLFLQLACHMTYANSASTEEYGGQIVYTGIPVSTSIKAALDWKDTMYYRGLKTLCDCGAIRKVARGVYQINPSYAGRGEWKYNPRLSRGGVEDLKACFDFSKKTVSTKIVWADDGEDSAINQMYRDGMGVKPSDHTVLKEQTVTPEFRPVEAYDQMEIRDTEHIPWLN